jgi:hypothetical protein
LVSGEAKEDMHTFLEALKALSRGIVAAAEFFGLIPDKSLQNQPTGLNWFGQAMQGGWSGSVENGNQIVGANQRITSQLQKFNKPDMSKVDPKLVESLNALGLRSISGYRSKEYAQALGIWHEGSHHTYFDKEGRISAVDIDPTQVQALMSKYSDKELKEKFDIYRPYPTDPAEQNHFERWSTRNNPHIYVYVNGQLQPVANMAAQQK